MNEETESNAEADTTIKGGLIDKRLLMIKFESSYHEVEKTGVREMENQKFDKFIPVHGNFFGQTSWKWK